MNAEAAPEGGSGVDRTAGTIDQQTTSANAAQADALRFMHLLWDGLASNVVIWLGYGGNFSDTGVFEFARWEQFSRPTSDDFAAIATDLVGRADPRCNPTVDVYIAPMLRTVPDSRRRGTGAGSYFAIADIDGATALTVARQLVAAVPGSFLVGSGSADHGHLYLKSSHFMDEAETEDMSRRLMHYLGEGADAKWSSTTVLRLPGTWSFKDAARGGSARQIVFLTEPDPNGCGAELGALLPRIPGPSAGDVAVLSRLVPQDVDQSRLPRHVAQRLEEAPGTDRSGQAFGLVSAAIEWGYSDGQVLDLAMGHRPSVDKYGPRLNEEVARMVTKLRPHHDHVGKPCDHARCASTPPWMTHTPPDLGLGSSFPAASESDATTDPDPGGVGCRLVSAAERRGRPKPVWLIEDVMPDHGVGQAFGESGGGKTFATVDLGLRLCNDSCPEWHGHAINRHGDVVYVLMEGAFDIQTRIDAWLAAHPDASDERLWTLEEEEVDLARVDSIARVEQDIALAGIAPVLIVFDTQSLAAPGVDEDSNPDMNLVMSNLKALSKRMNCPVLTVHHTGHKNKGRARGASAQRAALDFELEVQNNRVRLTKSRASATWEIGRPFHLAAVPEVGSVYAAEGTTADTARPTAQMDGIRLRVLTLVRNDPGAWTQNKLVKGLREEGYTESAIRTTVQSLSRTIEGPGAGWIEKPSRQDGYVLSWIAIWLVKIGSLNLGDACVGP